MKTFLLFIFVVSLLPYISNGRRKQRKVVFTEEEILSSTSSRKGLPRKRIKNPDFFGQLPNQVFVVVSKMNTRNTFTNYFSADFHIKIYFI